MIKKILLGVLAIAVVASGIAAMSAFEAHIINVTAHIENALSVSPDPLEFGTVFPQEYVEQVVTIKISDSFDREGRVDDVEYVIKQKPKPIWPVPEECEGIDLEATIDEARAYCHDNAGDLDCCYLSLCPYLSKEDGDPEDDNDTGIPSYYRGTYCTSTGPTHATGRLAKSEDDLLDLWIIDLKVPPVRGYVGQDWPENCPVVAANDQDYGCDLWIEVTDISRNQTLRLENKTGEPDWEEINDDMFGDLIFNTSGSTFNYSLTAQGLFANTAYTLIYYGDPWPGDNPGAFIGSGTTDGTGNLTFSGNPDLGMDLPDPADANYPDGAKIWLVLSSDYDAVNTKMTAWNWTKYLFERELILYDDTDI